MPPPAPPPVPPPLQVMTAAALLRGEGVPTVKSVALTSVSAQPFELRCAEVSAAVSCVGLPSEQLAAVP